MHLASKSSGIVLHNNASRPYGTVLVLMNGSAVVFQATARISLILHDEVAIPKPRLTLTRLFL